MMFDIMHIHSKFLPKIKELDSNGYAFSNLQTKDFEGLLEAYHVGEDGVLLLDKVEYVFIENTELPRKGKWNPPFFQEEKSRTKVVYPYNGTITAGAFFMDYKNPKDEIFVDIDFKFIDGVLQKVGTIKELQITPLQKVLERREQILEKRNKKEKDIKYRIFNYFSKFVNILILKLSKIQFSLTSYQPK